MDREYANLRLEPQGHPADASTPDDSLTCARPACSKLNAARLTTACCARSGSRASTSSLSRRAPRRRRRHHRPLHRRRTLQPRPHLHRPPHCRHQEGAPRLLGGPSTDVARMGSRAGTAASQPAAGGGAQLADGPAGVNLGGVLPDVAPATLNFAQSCYICKARRAPAPTQTSRPVARRLPTRAPPSPPPPSVLPRRLTASCMPSMRRSSWLKCRSPCVTTAPICAAWKRASPYELASGRPEVADPAPCTQHRRSAPAARSSTGASAMRRASCAAAWRWSRGGG